MSLKTVSMLDSVSDTNEFNGKLSSTFLEISKLNDDESAYVSKKISLQTLFDIYLTFIGNNKFKEISSNILTSDNTWTGYNTFTKNINGCALSSKWV